MRCTISFEVFLAHSKATNIITRSSLSQLFLYLIHSISGHNFSDAFAHYIVALFRSHFVVFVPKIFRHRNVCCATAHISLSLIHFSFLVCLVSFFIVSSLCSLFRCFDICLGVCVCVRRLFLWSCAFVDLASFMHTLCQLAIDCGGLLAVAQLLTGNLCILRFDVAHYRLVSIDYWIPLFPLHTERSWVVFVSHTIRFEATLNQQPVQHIRSVGARHKKKVTIMTYITKQHTTGKITSFGLRLALHDSITIRSQLVDDFGFIKEIRYNNDGNTFKPNSHSCAPSLSLFLSFAAPHSVCAPTCMFTY